MNIKRCNLLDFGILTKIAGDSLSQRGSLCLKEKLRLPWIHILIDEDRKDSFLIYEFIDEVVCYVHVYSDKSRLSLKELMKFVVESQEYISNHGCEIIMSINNRPEIQRLLGICGGISVFETESGKKIYIKERN